MAGIQTHGKPWRDFNQGSTGQDWQKRAHHRPKTDHEIAASRRHAVEAAYAAHKATPAPESYRGNAIFDMHNAKMGHGHESVKREALAEGWDRQKAREEVWNPKTSSAPTIRQAVRMALHGEAIAGNNGWHDPAKQWQGKMAGAVVEGSKLPPAVQTKLHAVSQDLHNGRVTPAERHAFDQYARSGDPLAGAIHIAVSRHGHPRHWR